MDQSKGRNFTLTINKMSQEVEPREQSGEDKLLQSEGNIED